MSFESVITRHGNVAVHEYLPTGEFDSSSAIYFLPPTMSHGGVSTAGSELAEHLRHPVYTVDHLGTGASSRQTLGQLCVLNKPRFMSPDEEGPYGEATLEAILGSQGFSAETQKIIVGQSIGGVVATAMLSLERSEDLGNISDVFLDSLIGLNPPVLLPRVRGFSKYFYEQFRGGQNIAVRLGTDASNKGYFPDFNEILTWLTMPNMLNGESTTSKIAQMHDMHPEANIRIAQGSKEFDYSPKGRQNVEDLEIGSLKYNLFEGHGHELFDNPTLQAEYVHRMSETDMSSTEAVLNNWLTDRQEKAQEFIQTKVPLSERIWLMRTLKKVIPGL